MQAPNESGSRVGGALTREHPDERVGAGFVLSSARGTLDATGTRDCFDDVVAARRALAAGADIVVGALPFDPDSPAALTVPRAVRRTSGPWSPEAAAPLPAVHVVAEIPSRTEHLDRVRQLIDEVSAGRLQKVVSARSIGLEADAPIEPRALLARLVAQDAAGNGFGVDLTPAGGRYRGRCLVGSSPEILIRRHGRRISCRPLAGSAARRTDAAEDRRAADELLASAKDRHEHSFVVRWLRERLSPLCAELSIPDEPSLLGTPELWHLGTQIEGTVADPNVTALDLAVAVHPTPAVCGTPTEAALGVIRRVEEDRGFYAGTVGWCDSAGDGEWMVAIRCAEISADGLSARAFAGGGIVADSVPADELAETSTKLRTLLSALGVAERSLD